MSLCLLTERPLAVENKALPVLRIRAALRSYSCECCGSFSSGEATLTFPDGRSFSAEHDGHFGEGCWSGDSEHLYFWALQAMGIEVWVDGERAWANPFMERSCGEWEQVNLFPDGQRQRVDFTREWEPDPEFPGTLRPVRMRWTSLAGAAQEALADTHGGDWYGTVEEAYLRLLLDVVQLKEG